MSEPATRATRAPCGGSGDGYFLWHFFPPLRLRFYREAVASLAPRVRRTPVGTLACGRQLPPYITYQVKKTVSKFLPAFRNATCKRYDAAEKEDYDYDSAEKEDPTTTRNPTPMVDEDAAQETPAAAAAAADGDADPTTEKEEEKEGGHEFDMFELMAKGALEPSSSEGEDLWPSQQELAANAVGRRTLNSTDPPPPRLIG
jgi:hypothetical protein